MPFMDRRIAHLDMDAFYASVELLRYPRLKGLPVVIGGRRRRELPDANTPSDFLRLRDYAGRGVATTATYEARALGVHSGMGLMKAAALAPDAPKLHDDGNLTGIVTINVDDRIQEIPGTEKTWEADLILLSMGFLQPEHYINEALGMEIDNRGNFAATKENFRTSVPKVYAAADCRRGQDLVVRAINEGREAAREIDRDLMGSTQLP